MKVDLCKIPYRFYCGKIVNNWLYFSALEFNGLFRADIQTGEACFVTFFDQEKLQATRLHRKAILLGENLVFLPQWGNCVHIYNYLNDTQKSFVLPLNKKRKTIVDAVVLKNKLFLFPMRKKQPILILDVESGNIYEDSRFSTWLSKFEGNKEEILFNRIVVKGDHVWTAVCGDNKLYDLDLVKGVVKEYETNINEIFGIYESENGFWITCLRGGMIYKWNSDGETCIYGDRNMNIDEAYSQIIEFKDKVYVIPAHAMDIYILKNGYFNKELYPNNLLFVEGIYRFFGYDITENTLWVFPYAASSALVFSDNDTRSVKIRGTEKDIELIEMLYRYRMENETVKENDIIGIEMLLWLIESNGQKNSHNFTFAGENIWKEVK